jgi:hypothetical protein
MRLTSEPEGGPAHEHHRPHRRDRPSGVGDDPTPTGQRTRSPISLRCGRDRAAERRTACGGAHASSASTVMSGARAYANCMRSHEVPDFPDPTARASCSCVLPPESKMGGRTPVGDLIPGSPAFQAAATPSLSSSTKISTSSSATTSTRAHPRSSGRPGRAESRACRLLGPSRRVISTTTILNPCRSTNFSAWAPTSIAHVSPSSQLGRCTSTKHKQAGAPQLLLQRS